SVGPASVAGTQAVPASSLGRLIKPDIFFLGATGRTRRMAINSRGENATPESSVGVRIPGQDIGPALFVVHGQSLPHYRKPNYPVLAQIKRADEFSITHPLPDLRKN